MSVLPGPHVLLSSAVVRILAPMRKSPGRIPVRTWCLTGNGARRWPSRSTLRRIRSGRGSSSWAAILGGQVWGAPKSHEQREVPIPRFLIDDIAEHIRGKKPDELVFTGVRGGGALRAAVFRRAGFDKAAEAIGVAGLHPHALRHTAASLAIASGANVKARAADARPQVRDGDPRSVRPPVRGRSGHDRGPVGCLRSGGARSASASAARNRRGGQPSHP